MYAFIFRNSFNARRSLQGKHAINVPRICWRLRSSVHKKISFCMGTVIKLCSRHYHYQKARGVRRVFGVTGVTTPPPLGFVTEVTPPPLWDFRKPLKFCVFSSKSCKKFPATSHRTLFLTYYHQFCAVYDKTFWQFLGYFKTMGSDWLSSQRFSWKNLLKQNYFQQTPPKIFAVWNWGHVRPGHVTPQSQTKFIFFLAFAGHTVMFQQGLSRKTGGAGVIRGHITRSTYFSSNFKKFASFSVANHEASAPIRKCRGKNFPGNPPPFLKSCVRHCTQ